MTKSLPMTKSLAMTKINKNTRNQSAFSLIEILICLLILSLCSLGTGKILVKHIAQQQVNEQRERVTILIWSIVDHLKANPKAFLQTQSSGLSISLWQKELKTIAPGSHLSIQNKGGGVSGNLSAEIMITLLSPTLGKIELLVIV